MTAGGMPGWQIALIAAGAAVLAALLAVTADRIRAARRHMTAPSLWSGPAGPARKEGNDNDHQTTGGHHRGASRRRTRQGRHAPRRLIILASVVLAIVLAGVLLAVTALSAAAPAAHGTTRPLTGTGTGTMTLDLINGAATADFTGHLSPWEPTPATTTSRSPSPAPAPSAYTGTRIFVAANGDKVFSAITGTGTSPAPPPHGAEADTITGGTGRFAGASGTYPDTISFVVVSSTATSQTSRVTAAARGQLRY